MTRAERITAFALLIIHLAICTHSMWRSSAASDEPDYIGAGRYLFETNNWKITPALWHPPLAFYINSVPLFFADLPDRLWHVKAPTREGNLGWVWYDLQVGNELIFADPDDPMAILRLARMPHILVSCLLLSIVYLWTRDLFGKLPAAVSGLLYALGPTIVAHARYAHTDIPLAAFMTAQIWTVWLLRRRFTWPMLLASAVLAGGTIGCKVNGIFAIPISLILLVLVMKGRETRASILSACAVYLVVPFLVLWALYGCKIGPVREPDQAGVVMAMIAEKLPDTLRPLAELAAKVPVPMPQYARPFASIVARTDRGDISWLMGEIGNTGWWYYFPVAFLVKTPVPTILLILLGTALLLSRWKTAPELPFLLLPVAITILPAITTTIQIGIRHILPAYPLLFICAGGAVSALARRKSGLVALGILLSWFVVGAIRVHPSHLSYFNEFAGGTEGGEEWLSDSNIDYCEDFVRLADFQHEHGIDSMALASYAPYPVEKYGVRFTPLEAPASGWIAVQVMSQQMARGLDPNPLAWLDESSPVARVGGSIKIYRIEKGPF